MEEISRGDFPELSIPSRTEQNVLDCGFDSDARTN
jgi:hypothetical protein